MILLVHHSVTVRAHVLSVCQPVTAAAAETIVGCATMASARELLRANVVDLLLIEEWLEDGSGRSLVEEIRSAKAMQTIPIIWLGTRESAAGIFGEERMAMLPDSFVPKHEVEDRLPSELHRLLPRMGVERASESASVERRRASAVQWRPLEIESLDAAKKLRILVIDDSLTYRMQMREGLTAAGYEVVLAETGEQGLELAFAGQFTAAIVDNILPGIQGSAVIRRLRSEPMTRRLPCLLLTASEEPGNEIAALDAGADSFVRKDEVMEVILVRLTAILRSFSQPAAIDYAPMLWMGRRVLLAGDKFEDLPALIRSLEADGFSVEHEALLEDVLETKRELPVDVVVIAAAQEEALALCRSMKVSETTRGTRLLMMEDAEAEKVEGASAVAQAEAIRAGADDYVPASLSKEVLMARLETQVRRKRMEDENRALSEHLLRQQVEAEQQRELADERATHADEISAAKKVVELKAAEAERARLELEQVVESIPQMVLMASEYGELMSYNQRWLKYTGEVPSRDVPTMWRRVLAAEDYERHAADRERTLRTMHGYAGEYRLRSAMGEYRWFWIEATRMMNDATTLSAVGQMMVPTGLGKKVRWLATCTDIHDRKLAEEAMRRTEKLAATGRLAASIAHEINNPLEAVTNLLYLLEQGIEPDTEQSNYVSLAQQEIARVSEISKKTLAFYRESRNPALVDMAALIRETSDVYASRLRSRGLTLKVEIETDLRPHGLAGELRQIVSNLLSNAIDASPESETISVRLKKGCQWPAATRGVRLLVLDHGMGIPEHMREEIFKPFITTKGLNGTGLGLWVSSSIALRHGGKLRFWSSQREGRKGTCFSLFLPLDGRDPIPDGDSMGAMLREIGGELLHQD